MPHRFYCSDLTEQGTTTLSDAEFHHLAHVMRHQPGDEVELFSGNGLVATCRITKIGKSNCQLEILSARRESPPEIEVTIATAVPKGDRFAWLVEKATEIGVARIVPILTERSIVDPRDSKLDKMRQASIAACKQCGRNHLMQITALTSWKDFLRNITAEDRFMIAHPYESTKVDELNATTSAQPSSSSDIKSIADLTQPNSGGRKITVAIGPEGGFSESEVQSALALGAIPIQLGKYILRIETAAIAAASKYLF